MARRVLTAIGFLALAVMVGCTNRRPPAPPDTGPPIVTVAKPVVKTIDQFTDLTGTLAPSKYVEIRSRVTGRIKKVEFSDGKEVQKNQLLVLIDPAPFEVMLAKAKADVLNAQAKLEGARAKEDQLRKAGTAVSDYEKITATSDRKVAEANLALAEANVEDATLNLGYTKVLAPFDGIIDRSLKDEGNDVTGGSGQGTVLTTLVANDPIYAYFDVDESTVLVYRQLVAEGKVVSARKDIVAVEIQVKGEKGYPHKGTLDFVSNRLNPSTGSLQIRGTFSNKSENGAALLPGVFVRGRVPLAAGTQAILIPDAAVSTDQTLKVVYVVNAENRVVMRPVVLGPVVEGLRLVSKGLTAEDRVVIGGLQRVAKDMVVDPKPGTIVPKVDIEK